MEEFLREILQKKKVYGYCVKCRKKRLLREVEDYEMRNKKKAIKGKCIKCGTAVYKIKKPPTPDYW